MTYCSCGSDLSMSGEVLGGCLCVFARVARAHTNCPTRDLTRPGIGIATKKVGSVSQRAFFGLKYKHSSKLSLLSVLYLVLAFIGR